MDGREPFSNISLVCKDHAPKPGKYRDGKPEDFVGKMVKLGFTGTNPHTGKVSLEHMWVRVSEALQPDKYQAGDWLFQQELIGSLDNDPVFEMEYQCGDNIAFKIEEIEDVYSEED